MNTPIVYKTCIIPTDFSSGIWNFFWSDVPPSAEIQCTALLFQEKYDGADDYRLFYLGEQLKSIENEKLYFPELSHA